jgi:2-(1,2-epoxy-1,2-dihydrophenyl)acetyl-CoA isomerase
MSIDTGTDMVRGEVTDGVGIITLNRPERRNALHPEMFDAVLGR